MKTKQLSSRHDSPWDTADRRPPQTERREALLATSLASECFDRYATNAPPNNSACCCSACSASWCEPFFSGVPDPLSRGCVLQKRWRWRAAYRGSRRPSPKLAPERSRSALAPSAACHTDEARGTHAEQRQAAGLRGLQSVDRYRPVAGRVRVGVTGAVYGRSAISVRL